MSGVEYRIVWKREGLRRRTTIRQTLVGAQQKAKRLEGDFVVDVGSREGSVELDGSDWLGRLGVPPLEFIRVESRPVGGWVEVLDHRGDVRVVQVDGEDVA